ncbi:CBS domain-containing protein [[Limnothrix rosea] IAM M-220]|uniref:CBS domain-containing protein n=1 Tax=[Limnothrix rosea] IAM M-220 TaxID=454133 RepID=UPI0015591245|nr:CBS domain-containing protein [[Limnothrix rosea] IAM M-220]
MLNSANSTFAITLAIEHQFLTATLDETLAIALEKMVRQRNHCDLSAHGAGTFSAPNCLVVVQEDKLCGIFTEQDFVRLIAEGEDLQTITLGEAIQIPTVSICCTPDEDIFAALNLLTHHHLKHLPVVDGEDRPIGIITYDSLRKALPPINLLTRLHCVADVMVHEVVTAAVETSLLDVVKLMVKNRVGCVVISETGGDRPQPIGIVTERDIIQFHSLDLNLKTTTAGEVMSSPLFTLSPETSLWEAHQTMNRQYVRRLVVVNETTGEMQGLLSQTSLFRVLRPNDMYQMIDLLQHMVDQQTAELSSKNQQLQLEIKERKHAEKQLQEAHDHLKTIVKERTQQLHNANAKLREDLAHRERMTAELEQTLKHLQQTQLQLIQTEKMSGLGQLVAGIAHEINNPINFIYGNLQHARGYVEDILGLLSLYERYYPKPPQEIRQQRQVSDVDFVREDIVHLVNSMHKGVDRIRNLLMSLQTFSRLDESQLKRADIHAGIDSTLLLIQNRLQAHHDIPKIQVIRQYETTPSIECYPSQLNQVFFNLLLNAVDAVNEAQRRSPYPSPQEKIAAQPMTNFAKQNYRKPQIKISTNVSPEGDHLIIKIKDNGLGIPKNIQSKLFDPFFTTKPVGQGTGLGLSISYQIIVQNHGGNLSCHSSPNEGTEFVITLPVSHVAIAA